MSKVTFAFDGDNPDDRDMVRKIVHLDDVYSRLDEAYNLARNRRKYSENIDDEQRDFLTDLLEILWVDSD